MADWYNTIQGIGIDKKVELENSIEADMIYIINQSQLKDNRCKIPLFKSRITPFDSDSQKFGLKHNPESELNEKYKLGDFSTKFKSDPREMADIIQEILDYKDNAYTYDAHILSTTIIL